MNLLQIGSHRVECLQGLSSLNAPPLQQKYKYNQQNSLGWKSVIRKLQLFTNSTTWNTSENPRSLQLCSNTLFWSKSSKGRVIWMLTTAKWLNTVSLNGTVVTWARWQNEATVQLLAKPSVTMTTDASNRSACFYTLSLCRCANATPPTDSLIVPPLWINGSRLHLTGSFYATYGCVFKSHHQDSFLPSVPDLQK